MNPLQSINNTLPLQESLEESTHEGAKRTLASLLENEGESSHAVPPKKRKVTVLTERDLFTDETMEPNLFSPISFSSIASQNDTARASTSASNHTPQFQGNYAELRRSLLNCADFSARFPIVVEKGFKTKSHNIKACLEAFDCQSSGHPYEDGARAFSMNESAFFMLCDGVSGAKSKDTPRFVAELMRGIQKKITEKADHFEFKKESIKEILNSVLQEIKKSFFFDAPPSTTFSLVRINSEGIDYFLIGDSGLYFHEQEKECISLSEGASTTQFSFADFVNLNFDPTDAIFEQLLFVPYPLQFCPFEDLSHADFEKIICGKIESPKNEATLILASDGIWDNVNPKEVLDEKSIQTVDRSSRLVSNFYDFWVKTFEEWELAIKDMRDSQSSKEETQSKIESVFYLRKAAFLARLGSLSFGDIKPDDSSCFIIDFMKKDRPLSIPALDGDGIATDS